MFARAQLTVTVLFGLVLAAAVAGKNMNGEYLVSKSTNLNPDKQTFNTNFADKGMEYFDVYSPEISTVYGQVYWTQMDDVPLPPDIVKRFANKTIAITGYEQDQVMADGSSVPINWAYNHHYVFWVKGAHSEMTLMKSHPNEHAYWMFGNGSKLGSKTVNEDPHPESDIPTSQIFAEGNGGESRKSFHAYPNGVAQLIDSPTTFVINPMQIDTWNRDFKNKSHPFVPGPTPPEAQSPPNADYSGLLECPCTDRLYKQINRTFTTLNAGQDCGERGKIWNSTDCFAAIERLTGATPKATHTINDATNKPAGCFFDGQGAYFNEAVVSKSPCGDMKTSVAKGSATSASTGVSATIELNGESNVATITLVGPADVWYGVGINATAMSDLPYTLIVAADGDGTAYDVVERHLGNHAPGTVLKSSLTLVSNTVAGKVRTVVVTRPLQGLTKDHFSFALSKPGTVPLIVAIGSSPSFGYHKTHDGVVLSMFKEHGGDTCICSTGSKGAICGNAVGGCIVFSDTDQGQDLRGDRCPAQPLSDLAAQGNPTCTIEQYSGGLRCCHHLNILLSKSQNPWPGVELKYRMKIRFWFQDYTPKTAVASASHENLVRFYWQTESFAGEYDVPRGDLNMPGTQKSPVDGSYEYQITSEWLVEDMVWNCNPRQSADHCTGNGTGIQLRYAGGHCHAPSCKSIELYTNATTADGSWALLCRQLPHLGQGHVIEDKYDEKGYIALPPCLWGTKEEGLVAPITLPFGTHLRSIKINNSTFGHYGEMASWQMRGVMV